MAVVRRRARRAVVRLAAARPPLRRVLWTLNRLRSGASLKAGDLAAEFEISPRTAYRDLDFLRDQLQAPVEYDRRAGSYVLTDSTYNVPVVTLTRGELLALLFAEHAARQYRGTPFEADVGAAVAKLRETLPEDVRVSPDLLSGLLALDLGPAATPDPAIFSALLDALTRRHRLRVRYRSQHSNHTLDREIEPYRIFNQRGDWYVAAFDHRRGDVRSFALHRMQSATVLEARYEIPATFDLDAYLADAFGVERGARPIRVAVRFSPRQARWIREKCWHASARIQERLDGGCVLRLRVSGLDEVKRWVLQYGAEAEVLAPAALRRAVAAELAAAAGVYRRRT